MHDEDNELSNNILELMRTSFPNEVFNTYIPRDMAFIDSTAQQIPVILSKNKTRGSQAYDRLILEFLEKYNLKKNKI
jgi:chromosome partitioning protein